MVICGVLYVVDSGSLVGGAQRLVLDLLLNLRGAGWEPALACPEGELSERARAEGIPVDIVAFDSRFSPRTVGRLASSVIRRRAAVVHSHLPMSNIHAHAASLMTGVAHLATLHGEGGVYSKRFLRFLTLGRRTGLTLVSVSSMAAKSVAPLVGGGAIPYIHNGVDPERFAPRAPVLDTFAPVIGCIGRLSPEKGQDLLLRSFPRVLKEFPSATLALVGEGEERPRLEKEAEELGIAGRVRFHGYTSDVRPLLETFSVCVVPSRFESFGIIILEAGAMGRPVVATRVGGIPEILEGGQCGILVPPDQPVALADALVSLLRDPGRATALAESLRRRVRGEFSISRCAERYGALYTQVLDRHRGGTDRRPEPVEL